MVNGCQSEGSIQQTIPERHYVFSLQERRRFSPAWKLTVCRSLFPLFGNDSENDDRRLKVTVGRRSEARVCRHSTKGEDRYCVGWGGGVLRVDSSALMATGRCIGRKHLSQREEIDAQRNTPAPACVYTCTLTDKLLLRLMSLQLLHLLRRHTATELFFS